MKLHVKTLPTFATEATRIAVSRASEEFCKLSVEQVELMFKTWVYESIAELQEPVEASLLYFTRAQAAKELGVSCPTIDLWVSRGLLKHRWLGNRKIFLQEDIAAAVRDENLFNKNTES